MAVDIIDELDRVVRRFDELAIEYAVCGGLALAIHGHPRMTRDIDVLVTPAQLTAAMDVVRANGFDIPARKMIFGLRTGTPREMHRLSRLDDETGYLMSLDLLVVGQDYEEVWSTRIRVPWRDREISVVSRSGLAIMKRLAGRPQDLADLAVLDGTSEDEGT